MSNETIGLEELNNLAALQSRKDRKYIVPVELLDEVLAIDGMRVLEIDGRRSFRYESVYFDTPDFTSYRAAAFRRRRRFKVRTRSYLDSGLCSLEVKTRERRGITEKSRLGHAIDDRRRLTVKGRSFVSSFAQAAPFVDDLRPVLTTRYKRMTLLEPVSQSRITIDTELECVAPDGDKVRLNGAAVVETKTTGKPCAVDHALWAKGCRPIKISKFGTGLAALTPELPANKWHRVLRWFVPLRASAAWPVASAI